jgi:PAS domain S-box-containing protein
MKRPSPPVDSARALRESEARLRAIVLNAVDAIITIDHHGIIDSVNPATERMFGFRASEMVGQPINMIMPEPYRSEHDRYMRDYLRTGVAHIIGIGREVVARKKNGAIFPIDLAVSQVKLADRVLFVGTIRDLTDRNHLLEQVVRAGQEEQQRIGGDLHDGLGQQLTGAALLADALRQKLQAAGSPHVEAAEDVKQIINQSIVQLRALVKGLRPVELEAEGLMMAMRQLADEARLLYGIECSFLCDRPVLIDDLSVAEHLYYIAREAVHNAFRHGKARHITLRLDKAGPGLRLSIADDGVGIPRRIDPRQGRGLSIMQHRCRVIGSVFSIGRQKPHGTIVSVQIDRLRPPVGAPPHDRQKNPRPRTRQARAHPDRR